MRPQPNANTVYSYDSLVSKSLLHRIPLLFVFVFFYWKSRIIKIEIKELCFPRFTNYVFRSVGFTTRFRLPIGVFPEIYFRSFRVSYGFAFGDGKAATVSKLFFRRIRDSVADKDVGPPAALGFSKQLSFREFKIFVSPFNRAPLFVTIVVLSSAESVGFAELR